MASIAQKMLTADDIWSAKDIEERTVSIPQWGGTVRIRTFSKKQVSELTKAATHRNRATGKDEVDNDELEALIFTEGMIEPKFTKEDYVKLCEKAAAPIAIILKAIMDASGLTDLAVSEATKSTEG